MPNYITNYLTIKGDKDEIDVIIGSDFTFKNTISNPNDTYNEEWCNENWGCSSDALDVCIEEEDDSECIEYEVTIVFDTINCCPFIWLKNIGKTYKNLVFINNWASEDFPKCGQITCCDGDYVEDNYEEDEAIEFIKDFMPEFYKIFNQSKIPSDTPSDSHSLSDYDPSDSDSLYDFDSNSFTE